MRRTRLRSTGKIFAHALVICGFVHVLPAIVSAQEFHPNAAMQQAGAALQKGDTRRSIRLFEAEAKRGNAFAMFALGEIYFRGHGVPRDYKRASHWYGQAWLRGGDAQKESIQRLGQIAEATGYSRSDVEALLALATLARMFPGKAPSQRQINDDLGRKLGWHLFNEMTDHEYENPLFNPGY